jgi:hypothetical protein
LELRVHGIGGPTAQSVLGVHPEATCRRVWPLSGRGEAAVRVSPANDQLAAYHWAPLTSGSRFFALWPLLLPFTVINVAGYMRPKGIIRGFLVERLVSILALATTAAWTGWSVIAAQAVLRDQGGRWKADALGAVLVLAPLVVAKVTRRAFERFPGASPDRVDRRLRRHQRQLRDEDFFDGRAQVVAGVVHATVGVGAFFWVVHQRAAPAASTMRVAGSVIVAAGVVQAVAVLLLATLSFRMGRRWWSGSPAASAAGLGVILLGGLFAGAIQWSVGTCPGAQPAATTPDACRILNGNAWMLVDVAGWALLVAFGSAVAVVLHTVRRPLPGESGPEMRRLLPTWLSRMRARAALLPSRLAPVLGAAVATFFVAGSLIFTARAWPVGASELCDRLPVGQSVGPCSLARGRILAGGELRPWVLTDTPPVTIARWAFLGLLVFMGLNLVKSRGAHEHLRRVGQLWDVLTFWPRRFHPLGVRPYAERAVPELRQLLVEHPDVLGPGDLVVTAHSQGSVLVVAAVAPYRSVPGLRLLTMGSPLRVLHANVFPHYVNRDLVQSVCGTLGPGRWRNTFRLTDHVGRSVFGEAPTGSADEFVIPDPSEPGKRIEGHSNYWDEAQVLLLLAQWSPVCKGAQDA